jgi:hypothetical protein
MSVTIGIWIFLIVNYLAAAFFLIGGIYFDEIIDVGDAMRISVVLLIPGLALFTFCIALLFTIITRLK